jgi:hypothetical protein
MTAAHVKHLGPGLVVGELGPVCVTIWRDEVDAERFEKQAEGVASIARRFPRKSAYVCIVEPTCAPPDEALRKRSIALVNDHDDSLACVAGVIEGTGFRAAITRSVLAGIALFFRNRAPHHFFSDVPGMAAWVAQKVDVDAAQLASAIEQWRASLPPPRTPID